MKLASVKATFILYALFEDEKLDGNMNNDGDDSWEICFVQLENADKRETTNDINLCAAFSYGNIFRQFFFRRFDERWVDAIEERSKVDWRNVPEAESRESWTPVSAQSFAAVIQFALCHDQIPLLARIYSFVSVAWLAPLAAPNYEPSKTDAKLEVPEIAAYWLISSLARGFPIYLVSHQFRRKTCMEWVRS